MSVWKRHFIILAISILFVLLFFVSRSNWHPLHAWNRAFADTSLLLLMFTIAVGPCSRIFKGIHRVLPWRRELGIWTAVLSIVHIYIILDGWVMWEWIMLFKVPVYDQLIIHPGFALGNLIGIVAFGYMFMLALISNPVSIRMLGTSAWNYLQQRTSLLYVLVLLHTVYFLFFHMPEQPNWLRTPLIWGVTVLFILQVITFVVSVRRHGRKD